MVDVSRSQTQAPTLTLHLYRAGGGYRGDVTAVSLTGEPGTQTAAARDGDWLTLVFIFPAAASDDLVGFTLSSDSAYPDQLRFVRQSDGSAEAWIVDGDPRVYEPPAQVEPSVVVERDGKRYVPVAELAAILGLSFEYGPNSDVFDGAAAGTASILTIRRGRDTFEIDVRANRLGRNLTGAMLRSHTETVFTDVDGFESNGEYHLSLGSVAPLLQVGTVLDHGGLGGGHAYVLPQQFTVYDSLQPVRDPADVGFSAARLDALDRYVREQAEGGGPSLAISIVKDGKIVKQAAYGYAKKYEAPLVHGAYEPARLLPRERWEPATVDTMYDLASNTKMYATNYAIQRLVSYGRIDLDRTLQSFPGWENYTDQATRYTGDWTIGGPGGLERAFTGKSTITLRDLLHHTAGEIPDPQYPNREVAGDLYYQGPEVRTGLGVRDRAGIIDAICRTPLIAPPRTAYLYSDVDYMILGLIVEQVTGQALDEYLRENFYDPLGLERTTFNPLQRGIPKRQIAATELNGNTRDGAVSFGTLPDGEPVPMRHETVRGEVHDEKAYYSMGGVSGHAGLFSTVRDMAVLTQLMLGGGLYGGRQYFAADVAAVFTAPFALDAADIDTSTIGMGWRLHAKSSEGYSFFNWGPSRSAYGHEGWAGTLTIIDPVYGMTITILTNKRHSPVVEPPNGFASREYPISDLVPVSARVYAALLTGGE